MTDYRRVKFEFPDQSRGRDAAVVVGCGEEGPHDHGAGEVEAREGGLVAPRNLDEAIVALLLPGTMRGGGQAEAKGAGWVRGLGREEEWQAVGSGEEARRRLHLLPDDDCSRRAGAMDGWRSPSRAHGP
jgi:hypothetical protein